MSSSRTISLLTIVALALTLLPLATTPKAAYAAEPRLVRAGELGPSTSTALGDLDSDGDLDIVLQVDTSGLHVRLNSGSGDFGAAQALTVEGGAAGRPILADMDGDGDLDIISGRTLFRNSGASFIGETLPIAGLVAAAGDFNGDATIDLVVGEAGQPYRLYHNAGDGTFSRWTALQGTESASGGLDIGDVNGDGALDLVFGDLQIFFTDGTGAVSHNATLQFPEGFFGPGLDVRLGDINGE